MWLCAICIPRASLNFFTSSGVMLALHFLTGAWRSRTDLFVTIIIGSELDLLTLLIKDIFTFCKS